MEGWRDSQIPEGTIKEPHPAANPSRGFVRGSNTPIVAANWSEPARGSQRKSYWFCFAAAAAFSALAWNARPSGLPSEAPGVVADATPRLQLMASKTTLSTC